MPSSPIETQKIGIVACSGPGAALCFETITTEAGRLLGSCDHPEIAMHAFSFGRRLLARAAIKRAVVPAAG